MLTVAISLGTYSYIKSCGGGGFDPDEDTHNLISQELIGETPYKPYLFTANSYLYGDNEPNTDGSLNATEWSEYLGVPIATSDLSYFTDRQVNMTNAISYFETGKFAKHEPERYYYGDSDSSLFLNNIYKVILKNKDRKTLYYINTLRAIESALSQNYWDYKPAADTHKLDSIYYGIKVKSLKQKLPSFLKKRYTFLLCKLGFYTEKFDRFYPAYQSLRKLTTKSILLTWCRGYNAGFMRRRGQMDSASYEYSRIFVECPEIMQTAFKSFYWCKEKHKSYSAYSLDTWGDENKSLDYESYADFASVEKFFKSPTERADYFGLYINRSYIPACTSFLDEIIKNDPANEWVDVNLMRGIAQLEFYNSGNYTDTNLSNELIAYKDFIIKHIYNKQLKRPWLWLLGAGYLSYLNKEYEQSLKYYKEAEKLNISDSLFQIQVRMLIPLAYIKSQSKITRKEEAEALIYLENLNNVGSMIHTDDIRNELLNMLMDKYANQNEPAKVMGIKNIYYNSDNLLSRPRDMNIDSIIAFIERPSDKPYDNICKLLNKYTVPQLRKLKGEILLGQYKWREALIELEAAGDMYEAYVDVFKNIDLEKYETRGNGIKTVRTEFCKTMLELEQKIKTDKANANEILKYANGLYNMSYWGNFTSLAEYGFISNFWSYRNPSYSNDTGYPDMVNLYEYPMFVCESAQKYYSLAAKKSANKEFQAQCYFFAAICEQNSYYISNDYSDENEKGLKIKYRNYFKLLKEQYRNTQYYKDAMNTCSYLDAFDKLN